MSKEPNYDTTMQQIWERWNGRPKFARFAEAYVIMNQKLGWPTGYVGSCLPENANIEGYRMLNIHTKVDEEVAWALSWAAKRFAEDEGPMRYDLGCTDYTTNRAFLFALEACHLLCCGLGGEKGAVRLLKMAIQDIEHPERTPTWEPGGDRCLKYQVDRAADREECDLTRRPNTPA